MNISPDLTLKVHFFPAEEGGRKGETPKRRFNCIMKFQKEFYDCQLILDEVGALKPGQDAIVPVILLHPELLENKLLPEQTFTLCEGNREIASAKIVKVFGNS